MPKIRQALALLVAAGCCIGFNTFRYPVVREMAAAVSVMRPPASGSAGEKPTAAVKDSASGGSADDPGSTPPAGAACKDGVCTILSPESPTASIRSSHLDDSSAYTVKESAEKAASSENSEADVESTSKPWGHYEPESQADGTIPSRSWPTESRFDSKPPVGGESESMGSGPYGSLLEPASRPRESETTATAKDGSEAGAETGTIAKLVSSLVGGKSPPKESGSSTLGEPSLVPIRRPKSRTKKAATSTVSSSAGAMSSAGPSLTDKTVRRLPPVEPIPITDPTNLSPPLSSDFVATYPVTP